MLIVKSKNENSRAIDKVGKEKEEIHTKQDRYRDIEIKGVIESLESDISGNEER